MDPMTDLQALLAREAASLVTRLRLWTPARWAAAAPVVGTRADVVHHLAQRCADDAAVLEGQPRRLLPRLDSDLGLPDQLAVTADDLVRAGPPDDVARAAAAHLLWHRAHLLGEAVPDGLRAALGGLDVAAAGAAVCEERPVRPLSRESGRTPGGPVERTSP
jgi:hypothetical protein